MKHFYLFILSLFFSGLSFYSSAQTYTMTDGGSITACSGTLLDPGGTGDYSNNELVTYTICSGSADEVQLVFSSFSTESCCDDLTIYDGNSTAGTLIGTYAGTTSPGTITSTTGCLTLVFDSDGSVTDPGFEAAISCVSSGGGGGGTSYTMTDGGSITACSGTLLDPGGTGDYSNNESVTYTICSGSTDELELVFTSFSTESCCDDLTIYDGNSTAGTLIGTYAGTTSPGTVLSTTGCLTLVFSSDGSVTDPGFEATINCIPDLAGGIVMTNGGTSTCSATFTDDGGLTGSYSSSQTLEYTICPDAVNSKVQIDFTSFDLESSFDFLEIFDGNSTAAASLGTYTGTTGPGLVSVTPANTSGCLTFRFTSDGSVTRDGWEATVTCVSSCQTINSVLVSTSPAADADGVIRLCQGQTLSVVGSGTFSNSGAGATYDWTFGGGGTASGTSASYTYTTEGSYELNLDITDVDGCVNDNVLDQVIEVSTTPTLATTATPEPLCLGESSALDATVVMNTFNFNCTPPISGTTFLPDGSGVSYSTSTAVDCYPVGSSVTAATDIQSICLNMEHSYMGDLQMTIRCPNGQSTDLHTYPGGNGTFLGDPIDNTTGGPGTGYDYCFTNTATDLLVDGPTVTAPTESRNTIAAGDYLPSGSFADLVGCPLNGDWTLEITDNLGSDDGYIFSWQMNFDASVQTLGSFTPTIASQGWQAAADLTPTSITTADVTPAAAGNQCYTYEVVDNFGCSYTIDECVLVNALPTGAISGTTDICDGDNTTLTATGGTTYDWDNGLPTGANQTVSPLNTTTYNVTVTDANGCTTTTAETVNVTYNSTTPTMAPIAGTYCPNTDVVLSAAGGTAGTASDIYWYSGPNGTGTLLGIGSSINYTIPSGGSTVYLRREGSCNSTADDSQPILAKDYIYALNGTSTNTYCTDNMGWHHFYNGNEIIFSVRGDLSGAPAGYPIATIYDNGAYYQQTQGPATAADCSTGGDPGEERFEMERSWNLDFGGGAPIGGYEVRFYYEPAEKAAIETAAANWIASYPACSYTYKYATPNGFYWFKNSGSNYVAPTYDDTHYSGTVGAIPNGVNYSEWSGIPGFSGGSGAIILIPDPLLNTDWSYLRAAAVGQIHRIYWGVAQEAEVTHYVVERSADGINFSDMLEVTAQGPSASELDYTADDVAPLRGMNYYRVRSFLANGESELSEVLALNFARPDQLAASFFPNPTQSELFYQVEGNMQETVEIQLFDLLGKKILSQLVQIQNGQNQLQINLPENLPAGNYLIRAQHLESARSYTDKIQID